MMMVMMMRMMMDEKVEESEAKDVHIKKSGEEEKDSMR